MGGVQVGQGWAGTVPGGVGVVVGGGAIGQIVRAGKGAIGGAEAGVIA